MTRLVSRALARPVTLTVKTTRLRSGVLDMSEALVMMSDNLK